MSPSNPLQLHLAVLFAAFFNDYCINSSSESTKRWSSRGVQCLRLSAALGGHQAFAEIKNSFIKHQYSAEHSCVKGLVKIGKSKSKGRLNVQWNYYYGLHGFSLWGVLIKEENMGIVLFHMSRVSLSSSILLSLVENRAHLRQNLAFYIQIELNPFWPLRNNGPCSLGEFVWVIA